MSKNFLIKNSFFHNKLSNIIQWFNKEEPIKYNLTLGELINSFVIIIPVHSILYLWSYYSNFGTQYFLYFNPVDFINVFYANNISILIYALLFVVLFFYFLINADLINYFKIKTNIFLSILFIVFLLFNFLYWLNLSNINFYGFASVGVLVFLIAIKNKQTKLIYCAVIFFYFYYTLNLAKQEALTTKENKPNFNIILNDNSFALKKDTINHKDYFIGKVTDFVFIYSDSLKNVRVIPVKEIKEIQFPINNKRTPNY